MQRASGALVDTWYAGSVRPGTTPLSEVLERRVPTWVIRLSERVGPVRGILHFWFGRRFEKVVTIERWHGSFTLLLLEAWLRPRAQPRVVLIELIGRVPPKRGWRRVAYRAWFGALRRPTMRRALRCGHVMTEWEVHTNAERLRLPEDRFRYVPWPLLRSGIHELPPFQEAERDVVASGASYSDWDTLIEAAHGRDWSVTVMCGLPVDAARIASHPDAAAFEVLCQVPREEHDRRIRDAAVYALPLHDGRVSAGQGRAMAAFTSGTPLVLTRTDCLTSFVEDGVTALEVPEGDAVALREAIESLLADPARRRRMRDAAFDRARSWTYDDYLAALTDLVAEA